MKSEELKRIKAGALAFVIAGSMGLSGCTSSSGFQYTGDENNKAVAVYNSYINGECLKKCFVAEVYNHLLGERQLYIVRQNKNSYDEIYYSDLLSPTGTLFYQDNDNNNFFEFIKTTPVVDFINALGLSQVKYSHDDMTNILNEISAVYEFSDNLQLTK